LPESDFVSQKTARGHMWSYMHITRISKSVISKQCDRLSQQQLSFLFIVV